MDPIIDSFYVLADDGRRDKELKDWFTDVNAFVRTVSLIFFPLSLFGNRRRFFSKKDTSWKTSAREKQAS